MSVQNSVQGGTTGSSMNTFQKYAHKGVDWVADDLRYNTLTNGVLIGEGAAKGAKDAYKGAKAGFKIVEKKVAQKTVKGGIKGAASGYVGHNVANNISVSSTIANKVADVEKWFDNTKVGKVIDDGITTVENGVHKLIGGGAY